MWAIITHRRAKIKEKSGGSENPPQSEYIGAQAGKPRTYEYIIVKS